MLACLMISVSGSLCIAKLGWLEAQLRPKLGYKLASHRQLCLRTSAIGLRLWNMVWGQKTELRARGCRPRASGLTLSPGLRLPLLARVRLGLVGVGSAMALPSRFITSTRVAIVSTR